MVIALSPAAKLRRKGRAAAVIPAAWSNDLRVTFMGISLLPHRDPWDNGDGLAPRPAALVAA